MALFKFAEVRNPGVIEDGRGCELLGWKGGGGESTVKFFRDFRPKTFINWGRQAERNQDLLSTRKVILKLLGVQSMKQGGKGARKRQVTLAVSSESQSIVSLMDFISIPSRRW